MTTDTERFFKALYPDDVPDSTRLLIWTLPDKTSHWCATIADAVRISEQRSEARANVYIGAGLGKPGLRQNVRVKNADVLGIPGLWVDIDYKDGDAHKKTNLPTEQEAQGLIKEISGIRAPSLVVHSGHGYQLWWRFSQTMMTMSDAVREEASNIQRGWVYAVRDIARRHEWDVDATIDLARVMRVPGTFNYKGDPIPVRIVSSVKQQQTTYTPSDFHEFATGGPSGSRVPRRSTPPSGASGAEVVTGDTLTLNPQAEPPFDKWNALLVNEPRVVRTWNRQRKDFKDTSASSYDMALASFAVLGGWTDQEITDLLIACRRYHNDDLKLREDYYLRTIERARSTLDVQQAEEVIDDPNLSPDDGMAALSKLFGVDIRKVTKFMGDPPVFAMSLMLDGDLRDITLGGIESIMTQRLFRQRVAAVVNIIIPKCPEPQWDKRAQQILNVLEEQELGPESTPAGSARAWIDEYLATHRPSDADWEEAALAGRPFITDEHVCVPLRSLAFWLRNTQGERITTRELARYMRMAGYEQYNQWINGSDAKKATTRSVWRFPVAARQGALTT